MKAMEEKLPSSRFIRVHRSFIVQKSKIKVLDRGRIVLEIKRDRLFAYRKCDKRTEYIFRFEAFRQVDRND